MRGISEERLREVQAEWMDKYGIKESMIIDHLIDTECKELNPWLPIENGPTDRPLLLYENYLNRKWVGQIDAMTGHFVKSMATHYQELPGDPET